MTEFQVWLPRIAISNQRSVASSPLLTDAECDQVIDLVAAGSAWSDASLTRAGYPGGAMDKEIRSALVHPLAANNAWPFARLVSRIADINADTYRFILSGIFESDAWWRGR